MTINCSNADCPIKENCRRWLDKGGVRKKFVVWNGECNMFYRDETAEERLEAEIEEKREMLKTMLG